MTGSRIAAIAIVGIMIASGLVLLVPTHKDSIRAQSSTFPTGANSDFVNLWVRVNGTDIGAPYPNAGQLPSLGMNYFDTNTVTPNYADYNLSNLADASIWGPAATTKMYILLGGPGATFDNTNIELIANASKTNTRIKGIIWDDFPGVFGGQTPATMHAFYRHVHWQDANLTQGALKLVLVTYQKTYYIDSAANWSSIVSDYDVLDFWFWPFDTYSIYGDWVGFEDAFMDARARIGAPEYWLGQYLHYYYIGTYPEMIPYEETQANLRLIEEGYATTIHLLENFWILNEPRTCQIVKERLDDYHLASHSTLAISGSTATASSASLITNVTTEVDYGFKFTSLHYQNVTVAGAGYSSVKVQEYPSGRFLDKVDTWGTYFSFIAQAGMQYRIYDRALAVLAYGTTTISTPTTWTDKIVTITGVLRINSTLTLDGTVIQFANNHYINTAYNGTVPAYGINLDTNGKIRMTGSMIQPVNREYTYFIQFRNETNTGTKVISIQNSTIAHWAGLLMPTGYTYINDTVLFMPVMNGGTWNGFWVAGSYFYECRLSRNLFYYPDTVGFINYIMPQDMDRSGVDVWTWNGNTMIGGRFPLYIDLYGSNAVTTTIFNDVSVSSLSTIPSVGFKLIDFEPDGSTGHATIVLLDDGIRLSIDATTEIGYLESYSLVETYITFHVNSTIGTFQLNVMGLSSQYGYRINENGTEISRQNGPSLAFSSAGNNTFIITRGYPVEIASLIILIPFFLTLGIMLIPVMMVVKLSKQKRMIRVDEVIRMFVSIIVGLALVGITYLMI